MKIENYKLKILLLALVFALSTNTAYSQTTDELRQNIQNHNDKIKQLETEIKAYESQIQKTSAEAQTLQGAIKVLDLNQKKIGTEIKKTETNITKTNLTIKNLVIAKVIELTEKSKNTLQVVYEDKSVEYYKWIGDDTVVVQVAIKLIDVDQLDMVKFVLEIRNQQLMMNIVI